MTSCATPAPRLPHPAATALAVPTTLEVNMRVHQYWHMTKVPPAKPMHSRVTVNPAPFWTKPRQAVGMLAAHNTSRYKMRAPYWKERRAYYDPE